jgi:uncharacterized surface protein with fasciclin (FAS1) repeats
MSRTTHPARRRLAAAVSILALAGVGLAACSDDESADTSSSDTTETTTTAADDSGSSDDMNGDDMEADEMATEPSGPACAAVPTEGSGSFTGMAQDPAATAASNNPELSTLVTAVQTAGLVDTLNGEGPFTIFAPANSAFEAIPADTLQAVLADQEQLTSILTYHVIAGEKLSADQLAEQGSAVTVQGDELEFTDEGGSLMVNGTATGACVDVPTANATVHIIDAVLMPPA